MRRKRPTIPRAVRDEILYADCAYCGDLWPTEIDHVIPFSRGGTNDRSNLVAACRPCNADKLDFTPEEWKSWRDQQGLPWPPPTRYRAALKRTQDAYDSGRVNLEEIPDFVRLWLGDHR